MKTLRRMLRYFHTLARELSDEGAYARYLKATGHEHSPAEWRRFSEGRHRRKYQNAKCC